MSFQLLGETVKPIWNVFAKTLIVIIINSYSTIKFIVDRRWYFLHNNIKWIRLLGTHKNRYDINLIWGWDINTNKVIYVFVSKGMNRSMNNKMPYFSSVITTRTNS